MNGALRGCAALALATAAAGCAVVTADGAHLRPGTEAFADYVEWVFRRQNETLSALTFALEDAAVDSDRYAKLEAVEADLLEQCDALNALATARRRGERSRGLGALGSARQAPDCERATEAARAVLGERGRG